MAQITIYLQDDLADAVRAAAKAEQTSQSNWIAERLEKVLKQEWPQDIYDLVGAWKDFPTAEELRQSIPADSEREAL